MKLPLVMRLWCSLAFASALLGCAKIGLGPDGSFHPDATAGIADYTGQGDSGEGWAGDSEGEGGPSAVQPDAVDERPH
jgi:hypothetical protein